MKFLTEVDDDGGKARVQVEGLRLTDASPPQAMLSIQSPKGLGDLVFLTAKEARQVASGLRRTAGAIERYEAQLETEASAATIAALGAPSSEARRHEHDQHQDEARAGRRDPARAVR